MTGPGKLTVIGTGAAAGAGAPEQTPEARMVDRLMDSVQRDEELTFIVGSGFGAGAVPRVADILHLAEQYALGRGDGGDLSRALARAQADFAGRSPTVMYAEYRRLFTAWVSRGEFDVIAQQAVLETYRPAEPTSTMLAVHGIWQRVSRAFGERVENDIHSWPLSSGLKAIGALLFHQPGRLGYRILTTSFDPLLEIAIRAAGGRAESVPLGVDGSFQAMSNHDPTIGVYHLHGFWRPTVGGDAEALLLDPPQTGGDALWRAIANLIHGDTVCVLGTSDWAGTITRSLAMAARERPGLRVLWSLHHDGDEEAHRLRRDLRTFFGDSAELFVGVDADDLVSRLAERMDVVVPLPDVRPRHRTRHHLWEQQLVSWPDATPPDDPAGLIHQLERRFGWGQRLAELGQPEVIYWPVRLQPRGTVIHMVQAMTAGALVRRGMRLVVSLDDFGPRGRDEAFKADLLRWVRHTAPEAEVEFPSLSEFITQRGESAEDLLRAIDPWHVAQTFYGDHNPSLYSLLVAIKAVPNLSLREIERRPEVIVQALLRNNAHRLLTPLTMWSFLHDLLREAQTSSVMTLGGWDEGPFWEQWRLVYGLGISQLYNPYCRSLSHRSGLVAWASREELAKNLHEMRSLPGWDAPGGYIHWLFQNALLLPVYLNHDPVPEVGGTSLRAWVSFMAAMEQDLPVLDVLADHISRLYLGEAAG